MTPQEAIAFAQENDVRIVDLRFTDLPGTWQHFSIPVEHLTEDLFAEGIGFDGSSIRGFQSINESDMLLVPDPSSIFLDPFFEVPTAVLICNVEDPLTREPYSRDARYIAHKAEQYLRQTGVADTAFLGPEAEFFLFSDVRHNNEGHTSYYKVDSPEGPWNAGTDEQPNLGHKMRPKGGYFPCPPNDQLQNVRTEMMQKLMDAGLQPEVHHHEVGAAGQCEIDIRFDELTKIADKLQVFKYIIKNTATEYGLSATFMPKPIFGDNGSGMHVHVSLWKDNRNIMYDESGYAGLSDNARFFIGGLLKHAPALLAFTNPTTNSYRRLVPGYEAPINLVFSQRNRSACVRVPMYSKSEKAKRVEFRAPDPSCNPYLAFAGILMAGLDGIQNRIEPPKPIDKDLYELPPEEKANIPQTPGTLHDVLMALKNDHEWLLKGDVFTADMIEHYIAYKMKHEVEAVALRPHPYEFHLYYDI
ncbi:type I glutamate--ammonia ligase [Fimbriimonadia bacterium ATM]|nr:MAG: type I glutamate--ammonia ligase [Armatimonadota bacterium]MBC6968778.1 type I glutamate--ammonia ligase [Armatimonadota bacterium]MCE7899907.1 type I glutamate--ammonia ligase [Armatimonadetes bacterium ATM1]MDL1928640.1 type I glutamate--ammonia ligase [Fimbriimonadia bacterium ATM]RIJ96921.1 MAG: type I glutamate--ammonia ligase [Armatimonadota bacterium]